MFHAVISTGRCGFLDTLTAWWLSLRFRILWGLLLLLFLFWWLLTCLTLGVTLNKPFALFANNGTIGSFTLFTHQITVIILFAALPLSVRDVGQFAC